MNRTDVMRQAAERTTVPLGEVEKVAGAIFDVIGDSLLEGETVNIRRFGKFELRLRRATIRKNPRTGDAMDIPDKVSVAFLPSSTLKTRLNA